MHLKINRCSAFLLYLYQLLTGRDLKWLGTSSLLMSLQPSTLCPIARVAAKRTRARDGFLRDHSRLIVEYESLSQVLSGPTLDASKRTWERSMFHAWNIFRYVEDCDESENRADFFNYIIHSYCVVFTIAPSYRLPLPDPANRCTDSKWVREILRVLIILQAAKSDWKSQHICGKERKMDRAKGWTETVFALTSCLCINHHIACMLLHVYLWVVTCCSQRKPSVFMASPGLGRPQWHARLPWLCLSPGIGVWLLPRPKWFHLSPRHLWWWHLLWTTIPENQSFHRCRQHWKHVKRKVGAAKWVKGQLRIYCVNDFDAAQEPKDDMSVLQKQSGQLCLPPGPDFMKMLDIAWFAKQANPSNIMAVLKRTHLFINTKSFLHVRLMTCDAHTFGWQNRFSSPGIPHSLRLLPQRWYSSGPVISRRK